MLSACDEASCCGIGILEKGGAPAKLEHDMGNHVGARRNWRSVNSYLLIHDPMCDAHSGLPGLVFLPKTG
ncbi:hypothetical protein RA8CHR_01626 [Variovorax sp. RA8]|nr:hypothetical protein RA8CHR_01626 [Variovorax sp. RA8]